MLLTRRDGDTRPCLLHLLLLLLIAGNGVMCSASKLPRSQICADVSGVKIEDPPAPDYLKALQGSYTLSVEITLLTKNATYHVTEVRERNTYHGVTSNNSVVHLRYNGTESTMYYSLESGAMLEERDGICTNIGMEEAPLMFWGWLDDGRSHDEGLTFGPSSILRKFHFGNKRYLGSNKEIRGVHFEEWQSCQSNEVDIHYFFSQSPWQTADGAFIKKDKWRLPNHIEVFFGNERESIRYNMISFLPYVEKHDLTEVPRELSCQGMIAGDLSEFSLPRIPSHFSYSQETVQTQRIDGSTMQRHVFHSMQVTYNKVLNLKRFDFTQENSQDTSYDPISHFKVIKDFNTGVEYVINKDLGKCSRSRISTKSIFGSISNEMLPSDGSLVEPNDIFHLDNSFSFVGIRNTRGIGTELWVSTRSDIPNSNNRNFQDYQKAFLHHYFTKNQFRTPEGVEDVDVPLRSDLFVYNSSNLHQVIKMSTTNYYDFNIVRMFSEEEFSIEECFEGENEVWSYLILAFPTDKSKPMKAVTENKALVREQLVSKLVYQGHISPTRIASIDISEGIGSSLSGIDNSNVVIATVKILQRVPYIYSYSQGEIDSISVPEQKNKAVNKIHRVEDCAELCSLEKSFTCRSFHHCDQKTCFLSESEAADEGALTGTRNCTHWVLSGSKRAFQDLPSSEAYDALLQATRTNQLTIVIPYQGKTVSLAASEVLHYPDFHYPDLQYPVPDHLNILRVQFLLGARKTVFTNPDDVINQVSTLEECLSRCLIWTFYRCQSVAYLKKEEKCLLQSTSLDHFDSIYLKPQSDADVYTRSYLSEYDVAFGGISLNLPDFVIKRADNLDTCARYCSEDGTRCRSFEWCHDALECHLHSQHFLDVVGTPTRGGVILGKKGVGKGYKTQTPCIHFSKKNFEQLNDGSRTKDKSDTDPDYPFTGGDMAGVAAGMLLLGVLMTVAFLFIVVITAPQDGLPTRSNSVNLATMTYVRLKDTQGESES